MTTRDKQTAVLSAALLAAIAGGAAGATAGKDGSISGPLRCEIRDTIEGDTILLEPMVYADKSISGTYSVSVSGGGTSGSANIRQAGAFETNPGNPTSLGRMSVGASGAAYDVKLKVTAGGTSVSCVKQVPGAT
ncbi:curli-like amyloid fiber formation chaperone CsgH [Mesorhizobium sp. VK23B]|uniref:Curli-like amyloid fiber formation chaperone CsgH n=1 Tax=Mesorhizobium dulcispinae TaxID=3072316 RepID=A0ABU4XA40_9HYPH|nr:MULTISPECIES: curli-like amyloid fiber formation chaperone CsgH [unclassified Mesorhizobium]MDX8465537.1 curli-like amyloid fiber formation chaperone CsgH [Mesorhizobium sp. VK23B]MDX8471661.1 curli-like amyloid fiber formation chaperone CsgH [Mesorhizobium sp. VK23A]